MDEPDLGDRISLWQSNFNVYSGLVLPSHGDCHSIVDNANYLAFVFSMVQLKAEAIVTAQIVPEMPGNVEDRRMYFFKVLYREVSLEEFHLDAWPMLQAAEPLDMDEELEVMDGISSFTAEVFVVKNPKGAEQGNLPALFRKAATFLRDNDLDVDVVENFEYFSKFDEDINLYPEVHITVRRGSDG